MHIDGRWPSGEVMGTSREKLDARPLMTVPPPSTNQRDVSVFSKLGSMVSQTWLSPLQSPPHILQKPLRNKTKVRCGEWRLFAVCACFDKCVRFARTKFWREGTCSDQNVSLV